MNLKYRSDIDGLRAIAVMPVVLFHMGVEAFSGGYVGVDVFFVISGYLITGIIIREIENGDFSIAKFYERRCRRILPALTVILLASMIAGYVLLSPDHFLDLGKSAAATALFSSNIFFYMESGYFDSGIEFKPLLHTWSLAVEEQYYIFFPIILVLIAKFDSKNYKRWMIILGLLSFFTCLYMMRVDVTGAFYLIHARAWELIIGSILAIHILPTIHNQVLRDSLSWAGLMFIAFSVFFYTHDTDFPGITAVMPTLGAALIIYSGAHGHSIVGRILSHKFFVFIGLISYSLYLWHWPVIVYAQYYAITELDAAEISVMLMLTFILSVLSWHYVEKPFRKPVLVVRRQSVFALSMMSLTLMLGTGLLTAINNGMPERFEGNLKHAVMLDDSEWKHWESCEGVLTRLSRGEALCNIGDVNGQTSFIFWGDSHARALASAVDVGARKNNLTGKVAIRPACPPLGSIERRGRRKCHNFNEAVLAYIQEHPEIKTVVLAARWALVTNGTRYKKESGKTIDLVDLQAANTLSGSNTEMFETGLKRTISRLQYLEKTVILVKSVPEIGYDVPTANFVAVRTGRDVNTIIRPTAEEFQQRVASVSSVLDSLDKEEYIDLIIPSELLCDEHHCNVNDGDYALYRDDDHLSTYGAKYLAPLFSRAFSSLAGS